MPDPRELLEAALATDTLRPDDVAKLRAILTAPDTLTTARLLDEYHRDGDRQERTPRAILYMHIGTMLGALDTAMTKILHLMEELNARSGPRRPPDKN